MPGRPGPCSVVAQCARLSPLHVISWRSSMPQGTVKGFNRTKGYGFIQPQEGGKDVFVHISAVERAGLSTLNEGQTVQFELVENRGKTSAENLKVNCPRRPRLLAAFLSEPGSTALVKPG